MNKFESSPAEEAKTDHLALIEKIKSDPSYLPPYKETTALTYEQREDVHRSIYDHEIWNQEYVAALSNYIIERIGSLPLEARNKPIVILEAGAGTGRLIHFLEKQLQAYFETSSQTLNLQCIGVDNHSGYLKIPAVFPIENISYEEAAQLYQPDFVVASWPSCSWYDGPDSVQGYIAIGPPEVCNMLDFNQQDLVIAIEGFSKRQLTEVEQYQTSKDPYSMIFAYERVQEKAAEDVSQA